MKLSHTKHTRLSSTKTLFSFSLSSFKQRTVFACLDCTPIYVYYILLNPSAFIIKHFTSIDKLTCVYVLHVDEKKK